MMRFEEHYIRGPLEVLTQVGPIEALLIFLFFVVKVVLIAGAALFVLRLLRRSDDGAGESSGLQILEERYARGEITREEFMERRAVLRGQ